MRFPEITLTMYPLCAVRLLVVIISLLPAAALADGNSDPVCIECHSGLPEKYSTPVKLWRGSVHAENGIYCNDCHGGDPKDADNAMSPARGFLGVPQETDIPAFCGRCHVGVMKDYLASAHGRMLGKGGAHCVTCHDNHRVLKASPELINRASCSRCHSYERAGIIRDAILVIETGITALDGRIAAYRNSGADTGKLEKELFAARNRFHTLFHNVNVELVKSESGSIQADLDKIRIQLNRLDTSRQSRKLAGSAVVSFFLLLALLLHLLKKTFP